MKNSNFISSLATVKWAIECFCIALCFSHSDAVQQCVTSLQPDCFVSTRNRLEGLMQVVRYICSRPDRFTGKLSPCFPSRYRRQRSCRKIMFSVVCVRHSVHALYSAPVLADVFKLVQVGPQCTAPPSSRTCLNLCTLKDGLSASWHSIEMPSCYDSGQWSFQ